MYCKCLFPYLFKPFKHCTFQTDIWYFCYLEDANLNSEKEYLINDGQQSYQYQRANTSHSNSLNTENTTTYDAWIPGTDLGQAQKCGETIPAYGILTLCFFDNRISNDNTHMHKRLSKDMNLIIPPQLHDSLKPDDC